jgi:hypothetical protein
MWMKGKTIQEPSQGLIQSECSVNSSLEGSVRNLAWGVHFVLLGYGLAALGCPPSLFLTSVVLPEMVFLHDC